jgi:hypothetical protein
MILELFSFGKIKKLFNDNNIIINDKLNDIFYILFFVIKFLNEIKFNLNWDWAQSQFIL